MKAGSSVRERDFLSEEGRVRKESLALRGSERGREERKVSRPGGGEAEIRFRVWKRRRMRIRILDMIYELESGIIEH